MTAVSPRTPRFGPPEKAHLRLGFVALSDAAPLAVAKRLELGHEHGLTFELCRQSSWAELRDKLLTGELDAAHALYGLAYGVQLGIGGLQEDMAVLMVLNRNGQGISVSTRLAEALRETGNLRAALATLGRTPVFAQTFPTGTHAMWLNYWLAANGVDPLRDVRSVVIPPPNMVDALRAGELDGFCAGEPWHAVAQAQQAGRTAVVSSDIWPNHPEKVVACRRAFVTKYPNTARALVRTMLAACRWLDSAEHRSDVAEWLAAPELLGVARDLIAARLLGDYGRLRSTRPLLPVSFYDGGAVNYPRASDGLWFITQYRRWGMLGPGTAGNDAAMAAEVNQTVCYREAAGADGVPIPDEYRTDVLCDGRAWNGRDPQGYLDAFSIRVP
ncbi:CmpA/NrtA family ABC transporter substrate-binding protein [Pandoraea terrae]|nr:CmpA/NrtA family ABC transporter substrate-binding protein [Pandoraea terrae]